MNFIKTLLSVSFSFKYEMNSVSLLNLNRPTYLASFSMHSLPLINILSFKMTLGYKMKILKSLLLRCALNLTNSYLNTLKAPLPF